MPRSAKFDCVTCCAPPGRLFYAEAWTWCEKIAPTSSVDRAQCENALGLLQCHLHLDRLMVSLLSLQLCCRLLLLLVFLARNLADVLRVSLSTFPTSLGSGSRSAQRFPSASALIASWRRRDSSSWFQRRCRQAFSCRELSFLASWLHDDKAAEYCVRKFGRPTDFGDCRRPFHAHLCSKQPLRSQLPGVAHTGSMGRAAPLSVG